MQPCGKPRSWLALWMGSAMNVQWQWQWQWRWRSAWLAMALSGLCCLFPIGNRTGGALAEAQTGPAAVDALNAEARLLHRRLDLSGVMRWDRRAGSWQPLGRPTERLLVINLWSAHCKPCVDEFPLLRRMFAAWRSEPDVRFLFISDPPHDTEAVEVVAFWQQHAAAVPDADPLRSTTDKLRATLDNNSQPLTLLVDQQGVIRQAFVGAIQERGLASAMERLLKVLRAAGSHRL